MTVEKKLIRVPKPSRRPRGFLGRKTSRLSEKIKHKRIQLGLNQEQCTKLVNDTIGPISLRSWGYAEQGIIRKRGAILHILRVFLAKSYRRENLADGSLTVREL